MAAKGRAVELQPGAGPARGKLSLVVDGVKRVDVEILHAVSPVDVVESGSLAQCHAEDAVCVDPPARVPREFLLPIFGREH